MSTIHDVARKAKVSIASVSLVMNDPETRRVGATKRTIIRQVAQELGYAPSGIAKALNKGETKILGLVVPLRDPIFFNSFIAQVLSGIQAAIATRGYHLMIYSHQANTGQITANELRQSRFADGLIVLNTRMCTRADQENTIAALHLAHIPFVMANGYSGEEPIHYVGLDDVGTGHMAGKLLVEHGHRHIGLVSGAKKSPLSEALASGFKKALAAHKVKWSRNLQVYSEYRPEEVRKAVNSWLDREQPPTAIFCTEDQFAPDVYQVLLQRGLRIPQDVAVLGRGDLSLGTVVVPPLTTIAVPGFDMGKCAAEMLIALLENPEAKPHATILPGRLIERESV